MTVNKPFFAQLLATQELTRHDLAAVSGGGASVTQPDFRSLIIKTTPVTMRYPSDSDDLTTKEFPFKGE